MHSKLHTNDYIWARMASRYGHRWTSQFGDSADGIAGAEWSAALAGLSQAAIRCGFDRDLVRGDSWPPSSTQFRALCLEIPTLAEVKYQLRSDGRKSPFIVQVWLYLDSYYLARADHREADRMIADGYELAVAHVMDGGQLPEKVTAQIQHTRTPINPASSEFARKQLADLAGDLGVELSA